jgi:uncharacterized protein
MLIKLLLVIGVIAAVYFFFIKKSTPLTKERHNKKKDENEDETMVECAVCSTFITTGEAIVVGKTFYCSTECRDKA